MTDVQGGLRLGLGIRFAPRLRASLSGNLQHQVRAPLVRCGASAQGRFRLKGTLP